MMYNSADLFVYAVQALTRDSPSGPRLVSTLWRNWQYFMGEENNIVASSVSKTEPVKREEDVANRTCKPNVAGFLQILHSI